MSLPYDIARCAGTGHWLCGVCRRTEPGDEYQWMTTPVIVGDFCANHIPLRVIEDALLEGLDE